MRKFRTIELREVLNLWKIVDSGQCLRPGEIGDDVFRFISGNEVLELRQCGDCAVEVSCDAESWDKVQRIYFDLGRDYSAIQRDISESGDTLLTEATAHGNSIRVPRQEPFEMLVSFVPSQRKSIPATRTAVRELTEAYSEAAEASSGETVSLFPEPEVPAGSSEESLRNLGFGYRAPYVSDAACRVADGRLDLDAVRDPPDKEPFAELQSVYDVGKKVASHVMLFGYGRTERVPSDAWMQCIVSEGHQGVDPLIARKHADILQQYPFYYALTHKKRFIPRKVWDENREEKRRNESCDMN